MRPVLVGQSWGGNVVLELGWRHPEVVRGIACVDGGVIELADWFPTWEDCLTAMTPPRLDHLTLAELEARMKAQLPRLQRAGDRRVPALLPRPARRHHRAAAAARPPPAIVRSLWENRPSVRWPTLKAPTLLLLADSGDTKRTDAKRRAETEALAKRRQGAVGTGSRPATTTCTSNSPSGSPTSWHGAVRDGFFA